MSKRQMVILAGGLATRLRPVTEKISKSMIDINGKPFLYHQLELLKKSGFDEVILCVGFLSNQIENYFKDGSKFGISIKYSREEELLGTAGAIKKAEPLLNDEFFVMYGDSYLPINFDAAYSAFKHLKKPALVVVYKNSDKYDKSNMIIKDNLVKVYDKKDKSKEMLFIDAGISILNKGVLKNLENNKSSDLESLYNLLIKTNDLSAYETNQRFYEIGSFKGLEEFKQYSASGEI